MNAERHPVQTPHHTYKASISTDVTLLRAYEVYCHVFAPQEAMVTGGCRGGFSTGELIAFLFAYPFPKSEWRQRCDDVFKNMEGL
jgi:hypothetical protein